MKDGISSVAIRVDKHHLCHVMSLQLRLCHEQAFRHANPVRNYIDTRSPASSTQRIPDAPKYASEAGSKNKASLQGTGVNKWVTHIL